MALPAREPLTQRAEIVVRAALEADLAALLADIRPDDLAEGEALGGPGRVPGMLADSLRASVDAQAVLAAGRLVCVFGVAPLSLLSDRALLWMVGTSLVHQHRRALTRIGRAYIVRMLATYPTLLNVVDARNEQSLRWLRSAGATIHPAQPTGAAGLPFHLFTIGA